MNAANEIFQRFRGKTVLLDANLLLLYLIGTYQRSRIPLFKRTSGFSLGDFDLLMSLLAQFRSIITTPHVLTEVSNLANSLPEHLKDSWSDHFADQVSKMTEILEPAALLVHQSAFNPFGMADAALQSASKDTLLLTEDFRLSGYLDGLGLSTLNFREIALTLGS